MNKFVDVPIIWLEFLLVFWLIMDNCSLTVMIAGVVQLEAEGKTGIWGIYQSDQGSQFFHPGAKPGIKSIPVAKADVTFLLFALGLVHE